MQIYQADFFFFSENVIKAIKLLMYKWASRRKSGEKVIRTTIRRRERERTKSKTITKDDEISAV